MGDQNKAFDKWWETEVGGLIKMTLATTIFVYRLCWKGFDAGVSCADVKSRTCATCFFWAKSKFGFEGAEVGKCGKPGPIYKYHFESSFGCINHEKKGE